MPKLPEQAALIEVELLKDHAHGGEIKTIGDKISVDAPTADWLAVQGVIAATSKPELPAEQQAGSFSTE